MLAMYAKTKSLTCQSQSPLTHLPPLGPWQLLMIVLDVSVHYLKYHMHVRLTIGYYLPATAVESGLCQEIWPQLER